MATYREIKGLKVPYLDSDLPTASASTEEGGVWYNSGSGKLRAFVAYDTWSTSAPLGTARWGGGGGGTQTAGIVFAGNSGSNDDATEEYNGSGWAAGGNLNTARTEAGGDGTQTAAMCLGGNVSPKQQHEQYDGSSWSEEADLNTGRNLVGITGTTTAGLAFGENQM